jgi:hypothetical protein
MVLYPPLFLWMPPLSICTDLFSPFYNRYRTFLIILYDYLSILWLIRELLIIISRWPLVAFSIRCTRSFLHVKLPPSSLLPKNLSPSRELKTKNKNQNKIQTLFLAHALFLLLYKNAVMIWLKNICMMEKHVYYNTNMIIRVACSNWWRYYLNLRFGFEWLLPHCDQGRFYK